MPCRSDYLEATPKERDSRKFCELLCYVANSLGQTPPTWAVKGKDEYYGDADHVNEAVVSLCALVRGMTGEQFSRIVYDGRNPTARKLADFWDRHEAADAQREIDERRGAL